jgi:hypothetical protein
MDLANWSIFFNYLLIFFKICIEYFSIFENPASAAYYCSAWAGPRPHSRDMAQVWRAWGDP